MFKTIKPPEFGGLLDFLDCLLISLNEFWYFFYKNGNYVLFLFFAIMGIVLLLNSREKEYDEKIHAKTELVKRRGRTGTAVCVFIGFGFLLKIFAPFLYDLFKKIPEPEIVIKYVGDTLKSITSLEEVHTLNLYEEGLFFLISFCSLLSLLFIAIGIYLMCFNKFVIRSKLKYYGFIAIGIAFWLLFGFKASLRLLA